MAKAKKAKQPDAPAVLQLGTLIRGDEIAATNEASRFFGGTYLVERVLLSGRQAILIKLGRVESKNVEFRISEFEIREARFTLKKEAPAKKA